MYGKSYDGVTGLVGLLREPKGLAAVIAQEPVYDLYRYLYMNRVRFSNSLLTPNLYNAIAGTPGTAGDELAYNFESLNDTSRPGCPAQNFADQQDSNHDSAYWKQRDLIAPAKGKKMPLSSDAGLHREQHEARRRVRLLEQRRRAEAGVVRPMGARARQRQDRARPAQDGPPGLVRRV